MADSWSDPAKGPDGEFSTELLGSNYGFKRVGLKDGDEVCIETDLASVTAPRDVVLRLLAAEASDRLGWVWEVVRGTDEDPDLWAARCGSTSWWAVGVSGSLNFEQGLGGYGREEIVAAMHGRFLLQDALREAGQ